MILPRNLPILLAILLSGVSLAGQSSSAPTPGLRLFSPLMTTTAFLVDTNGVRVHSWSTAHPPGNGLQLLPDGTLLRAAQTVTVSGLAGTGGGLQRFALDGTLLWDFSHNGPTYRTHHDIEPMPNGNVLLIVWYDLTVAQAVAAGRNPALIQGSVFRPDRIIEVQPTGPTTGQVVWEWDAMDHVVQDFDPAQANYGNVAASPGKLDINYPPNAAQASDWLHTNGIDYDPVNDWIVMSSPFTNEVYIIDHGTTTAEARGSTGGRWGRGGDILWRWGNPLAYRAGAAADQQLFFVHDPRFVPPGRPGAGNLTLFNNRWAANQSAVFELVLPRNGSGALVIGPNGRYGPVAPVWSYAAVGFYSGIVSSAERQANGNTLICSGAQGWLFEVTATGQIVWQYSTRGTETLVFHTHLVDQSLWAGATTISAAAGGTVRLDLIGGSEHAQDLYLVAGSLGGTTPGIVYQGVTIPLNADPFFFATIANPNTAILQQTYGALDANGRATAFLNVPPGVIPTALVNAQIDLAYVSAGAVVPLLNHASRPVSLRIVP
jgi:hypothetical protein